MFAKKFQKMQGQNLSFASLLKVKGYERCCLGKLHTIHLSIDSIYSKYTRSSTDELFTGRYQATQSGHWTVVTVHPHHV